MIDNLNTLNPQTMFTTHYEKMNITKVMMDELQKKIQVTNKHTENTSLINSQQIFKNEIILTY